MAGSLSATGELLAQAAASINAFAQRDAAPLENILNSGFAIATDKFALRKEPWLKNSGAPPARPANRD